MGIPWIFECTHYFAHGNHALAECLSTTEFVLRTIGCINLLRGCLIFFIFVCKESTLDKVTLFVRIFFLLHSTKNCLNKTGIYVRRVIACFTSCPSFGDPGKTWQLLKEGGRRGNSSGQPACRIAILVQFVRLPPQMVFQGFSWD